MEVSAFLSTFKQRVAARQASAHTRLLVAAEANALGVRHMIFTAHFWLIYLNFCHDTLSTCHKKFEKKGEKTNSSVGPRSKSL